MQTLFEKRDRKVKTGEKKPATGELASTGFAFRLFEALQPGRTNVAVSPYGARVLSWRSSAAVRLRTHANRWRRY
jgi:hypothetical protein